MIHNISGDALIACKGGILCHQTNYFGVMGAGIAAAIKAKLLSHDDYMNIVWRSRRRDNMYTTENCPFHCNTKDDPHCCPDCAANADYTDCVHLDGIGLCGCAACVAYNRECPFENCRPVRCEWFEVRW